MRSKYSRWDGTQDPFSDKLEIGELLDEMSEDLLSGVGPSRAIRRLMRRGLEGRPGLDDLRRRLAERRRKWTEATNLEGPLEEIRDKLSELLEQERDALANRDGDDARSRETFLDGLAKSPAAAIKDLMDYKFVDPQAQQQFNDLVEGLQQQILSAYFGQMVGAMKTITPDDLARMREMIGELNQMIAARERGDTPDFARFMERFGDFFPENPSNLDELLEVLANRMAAMSRLLASLSPEQRRQLQELSSAVLGDLDLGFEMEMLNQELRSLIPNLPWDQGALGMGEDPMSLGQAIGAIEELSDMEELEDSLAGSYPGAGIEDIDEDKLQQALGEQAVEDLRQLKQIEKALEEAGVVTRERGNIELTARGIRNLGERALVKVFEVLRQERPGAHEDRAAGGAAEPTGATRPWRFGDSGEISVSKTVFNAVIRTASERPAGAFSARLSPEDFELIEAESKTRTATVLLLDLSFSMTLRGHWIPAKRMALALQALIESKYPQDDLYFIGFSDYARRLKAEDLTATGPIERVYGTNMQHAFLLARRLLSDHPRASKQVIMVTDGEPTAHLEEKRLEGGLSSLTEALAQMGLVSPVLPGGGQFLTPEDEEGGPYSAFAWPPTATTIHKTLAEAARLAAGGVTLNIFMLEEDPGLVDFMDELARRTSGRIFQTAGQDIGRFVLRDFVRRH
ncbi:MAG: vWA domain-containing protein [Actinomycetota bacterium]